MCVARPDVRIAHRAVERVHRYGRDEMKRIGALNTLRVQQADRSARLERVREIGTREKCLVVVLEVFGADMRDEVRVCELGTQTALNTDLAERLRHCRVEGVEALIVLVPGARLFAR